MGVVGTSSTSTAGRLGSRLAAVGLRSRLIGLAAVISLVTIAVGGFGVQRMSVLSDQALRVYDNGAVPLKELLTLRSDWWEAQTWQTRTTLAGLGADALASTQKSAQESAAALAAQQQVVDGTALSTAARTALRRT